MKLILVIEDDEDTSDILRFLVEDLDANAVLKRHMPTLSEMNN